MHHDRWFLGPYDDLQHIPGSAIYYINDVPTLVVGEDEPPYPPGQSVAAQMISDNDDLLINPFDATQIPTSVVAQHTISSQVTDTAPMPGVGAPEHNTDVQVSVTKIPRPPNAYILYRRDKQSEVKRDNPGIKNNEICESTSCHVA